MDTTDQELRQRRTDYLERRGQSAAGAVGEVVLVDRGPHHAKYEIHQLFTNLTGKAEIRTNAYTELGTGMHYWKDGQWEASRELIEMHPSGAVARQGRHQVKFARNLNSAGSLDILTPDQKRLRSHVLGLYYHDVASGRFVLLAQVQDSAGELLPPNEILYRNAFLGLRADIRYTYRRRGIEQDVILRERPHPPQAYGLNPATTQLEVVTEFMTPPVPAKQLQLLKRKPDAQTGVVRNLQDEALNFGEMQMLPGRAFMLAPAQAGRAPQPAGMVAKRWVEDRKRVFLIEAVDFDDVKGPMADLPLVASVPMRKATEKAALMARIYPPTPKPARDSKPVTLASLPIGSRGLVLDFDLSGSMNDFTFRADTTYYLGADFGVTGTATFEGGTVIKYGNTNYFSALGLLGPTIWPELTEAPAIFTAKDDNTVGSIISGSTGNPTNYYATYAIVTTTTNLIKNVRIRYADTGVWYLSAATNELRHAQFVKCNIAIYGMNSGHLYSRNVLMHDCQIGYNLWGFRASAEHLTVNKCNYLYNRENFGYDYSPVFFLTNSLVVATTNLDTTYWVTNQSVVLASSNGVFQTVGAGGHYLADSSAYRNVGTTNISPKLMPELRALTTYPPVLLTNTISTDTSLWPRALRDTDQPDLGYHYPPLDYAVSQAWVDNSSTVTVLPGTAVGLFGWEGFLPRTGSRILSEGTAQNRVRFATYETAQELPVLWGKTTTYSTFPVNSWTWSSSHGGPRVRFRFTDFTTVQHDSGALFFTASSDGNYYPFTELNCQDCSFGAGFIFLGYTYPAAPSFKNNRFLRTHVKWEGDVKLEFHNNLFRSTVNVINKTGTNTLVARDNLFLESDITCTALTNVTSGYNAYVNQGSYLGATNATDVILAQLAFQTGALGNYYLNQTSALVNAGSQTAAAAGLYHFTTATNQVKETNSMVDIGFHYAALNTSGLPVDTDGDGLPDYFEDRNGNGILDAGETSWLIWSTAGNGLSDAYSDLDYDGVWAMDEYLDGTDPTDANSYVLRPRRLGFWRFNDTNWLGEQGQVPRVAVNIQNIKSWNGNGLQVADDTWARLIYRDVETNGSPNINLRQGSVRFWFKPNWASTNAGGTGPGYWGRMLSVGWWTSDGSSGFWDLQFRPDGGQITFNGFNGLTNYGVGFLAADISFHSNQWHQITLTYGPTSSALYIDGQLVQTGSGVTAWPDASTRATTGLNIGNDYHGGQMVNGQIREFETFNYPLAASEIAKPLVLGAGEFLGGGQFQFQVGGGVPGTNWTVQASSDLLNWTVVTNITATGGNVVVVDGGATNYPYRFYRAKNVCERSVNVFGYLRKTVPSGHSMISIPLNGANNGVGSLFASAPPGSLVLKHNPVSGGFDVAENGFGSWSGNLTLNPGEGVFFRNTQSNAVTLTFIGEIPEGRIVTPIGTNFGIYGSAVPLGGRLEAALGLPVAHGAKLQLWNNATANYSVYEYYSGFGWSPSAPPTVAVGDAFWVRSLQQGTNWVQDFFPAVAIASPYDNTVFLQPTNLTLTASVTNECQVAQVNYYSGATWLGVAAGSPYGFVWSNAPAGIHQLTARATDLAGNISTSRVVEILVNPKPTVTITAPTANLVVEHGNPVALAAAATNFYAAISDVSYYVSSGTNSTLLGSSSVGPGYSFTWLGTSNATVVTNWLTARATDIYGAKGTSAPVMILLDKRPNITLTSPTNSTVVAAPGNLTLNATATDSDGTIQSVGFYANGTLVAHIPTLSGSNYSFPWGNVAAGVKVITAVATDNLGLTRTSAPVSITIDETPVVTFVNPGSNGMVYGMPAVIPVTVTATDADGHVARVAFYHGSGTNVAAATNILKTVTNSVPYTNTFHVLWTNQTVGTHVIRVVATDNLGVTTTVARTIQVAVPPTVVLTSPGSNAVYVLPTSISLAALAASTNGLDRVEFMSGTNVVGVVANGAPYTNTVFTFAWTNAPTGTNPLSARVTDRIGLVATSTHAISVVVEPNWTVTMATSANGQVAVAPTNVVLTASVVSNLVAINRVEFFRDGTPLGAVTNVSPYPNSLNMVWTNATVGASTITAQATDLVGIVRTSAPVQVVVDISTRVSLTVPANGSVLTNSSQMLTAVVTSNALSITNVQFFLGTNSLGVSTSTGNPYTFNCTNLIVGTNYLKARAVDSLGIAVTSPVVAVVLDRVPVVTLALPAPASVIPYTSMFRLEALVTNTFGAVTNVAYFISNAQGTSQIGSTNSGVGYGVFWSTASAPNTPAGTNWLRVVATDSFGVSGSSVDVPVILNKTPNVALTGPTNTLFTPSQMIALEAAAVDEDGTVVRVDFYRDSITNWIGRGTNIGTNPSAFTLAWTNAPTGVFRIFARAVDNHNFTNQSAPLTITIDETPVVTFVNPGSNGMVYGMPAVIPVTVTATDADGHVARVAFYHGSGTNVAAATNILKTVTNSVPYTNTFHVSWTNQTVGTHVIRVVATDNLGVTTTVARTIQVAVPPTVVLTSPGSNAVYVLPTSISLAALAASTNGLDRVEFLSGTNVVGVVANGAPYTNTVFTFAWTNAPTGTNPLSARVTDRIGLVATSTHAISVVVEPNWTVTVATSANGQVAVAPTNVVLTASVVSNLVAIDRVEFFRDGTNSLGVDTTSPYGLPWNNATAGTNWWITARATSVGGIVRTSAPVQLIVDVPTSVSLTGVTNDAIVRWAASLPLTAVATNTLVGIQQVEFFQGLTSAALTNRLGVSSNTDSPFGLAWTNASAGTNYLTAVATDRLGVVTTASVVRVVVDVPPTVALASPTSNQIFTPPATITVVGVCASANGTVTNVAIYQGATLLANMASPGATFSYAWSNVVGGVYTLRAVATDNLGVSTESVRVTNVVVNGVVTVAITNPANWTAVVLGTPIPVAIDATDPENSITNVTLKAGNTVLAVWTGGPYQYTWTNAPLGTNILRAQATDSYGVTGVSAEVTVVVASPPWVVLVSPTNNHVHVSPMSPLLVAQAGTTNGVGIKQVEFFAGTNSLGVVTNENPQTTFSLTWTNPSVGAYALTVRATDLLNISNTSTVVNVIVDALPSVVLTYPATNMIVPVSATITLAAEASGNFGSVTNVQFYSGGTLLGTGTASGTSYSFNWSNVQAGTNSLTARATDNYGVVNVSSSITLIASGPAVSLTQPTNGTVVLANSNLGLAAAAVSPVGVSKVEFFLGTNSLGIATNLASPYTLTWTGVPVGTNYLTVRATDTLQMTSTSQVAVVIGNPLMSVAITTPTNGMVVVAPSDVVLTAVATNTLVGIRQVEFFRGTNSLGVATNSPYQVVWSHAIVGTNSITARSTDVLGMSALSAPVTLIVGARPTVAFAKPSNNSVFLAPASITNHISAWSQAGITQVELFQGVGTSLTQATNLLALFTNAPPYTNSSFIFVWPEVGTNVYSLLVRATDALGIASTVGITNVVVEMPPTVLLSGPTNGQVFSPAPATITLSASATGNFGAIASVEFFAGNALVGPGSTVNGTTYSATWSSVAPGTNQLTARARDIYGIQSTSAVVEVIVEMPPVVQITGPANNVAFQAPASIPIYATAIGSVGIERVEFFAGTNLLHVSTNAPPFTNTSFGILWTDVSTNVYSLTVRATDVLGISGISAVSTVVVDVPPSVTITSPTNHTVLAASTNVTPVTLIASAVGNYGAVTHVQFYHGNRELGTGVLTNGAYRLTAQLLGGVYQLTAVATDQWGLRATSAPVTLTMDAPTIVTVTEPAPGSVFMSPAAFTVSATATNSNINGTIQQVAFYDGTNHLATVTNPPYSFTYSNAALGYHQLTAKAMDGFGYEWSSPPVQIVVDTPPSVAITNPVQSATITTLDTLLLGAQASSSAVAVARVEFYEGTNYLGEFASHPYSKQWQSRSTGTFDFTAVAVDSVGVKATSAVVTVSVILPTAPVPVISPVSGLYSNAVSVMITSDLLGASFRFSVDGGVTWLDYLNGVSLQSLVTNVVVLARASAAGYNDSAVTVVGYTFLDTDGDGVSDAREILVGTNPLEPDTDNDGRSDGQELADGTNPLDSASVALIRLAAWQFTGTNWLAGERGQLPQAAGNVSYTPGVYGGAVRVNSTNAARLAYRDVEADGTANINVRNGTVRFWFRPDWDIYYGAPANPGQLIELGTRGGENPEGWWALRFDEQGLLHFTTQSAGDEEREHFQWGAGMPTWSSYSYGGWMQFTLTYSPTNILLYGNGTLLAEAGSGLDSFPNFAVRHAHGFSLGSDRFGNRQAQGSFSLVETYNHPLDADAVNNLFNQEMGHLAKLDTDYDGVPDQAEMYWYGTDPVDAASVYPQRLAYWQFSDTNWVVNHDYGWNYWYGTAFSPLVASNVQNVASWDGNALSISGGTNAAMAYRDAEDDGNPNINLLTGTVRFWFRPNWASVSAGGTGPGVDARLIQIGADDASTDFGVWRIFTTADGNTLGFYSRSNSTTTNYTWLGVPITWASGVWHQVVLSHSATKQDLFVDGQLVASQTNTMCYPDLWARSTHGISIGSDYRGSNMASGQFDTMETFNYPMDTNQVAQDYATQMQVATLIDSDYDGFTDAVELMNGSDPLDPNSVALVRLGYWSFNDGWSWQGDRGQWPRMPYAQAIPTLRTNGVRINAAMYGDGVLAYNETEADGIANINCRNGTVSFWFKPDWDSASATNPVGGPGHEAQLISLGSRDTNFLPGWWGMSLNPQGNLLTFSAQTNGESSTFFVTPITWQSNRWYHLTVAYSPTSSSLYVNGQLAVTGAGVSVYPDAATRQSYGLLIGNAAEWGNAANGTFDELETYNYVLGAEEIGQAYTNVLASMVQLDSDYDGRTDAQELSDGTDPADSASVLPVRLGYWRFDTSAFLGEQGQVPTSVHGVSNVLSWNGQALRSIVPSGYQRLAYRDVETNGNANINCREGSVSFWFRPAWSSTNLGGIGPGSFGRLIEMGMWTPDESYGFWSAHVNPEGTVLYFASQGGGSAVYLTAPINWLQSSWHQIVVTYGATGTAIYVDGQLATTGAAMTTYPDATVRAAHGVSIGSDRYGTQKALGDFEELETYNYPLTEAQVSTSWLSDGPYDTDGDGLSNNQERLLGTNPLSADSNGNGIADGMEDPDGDGLSSAYEMNVSKSNPLVWNSRSPQPLVSDAEWMLVSGQTLSSTAPSVVNRVSSLITYDSSNIYIQISGAEPGETFELHRTVVLTEPWTFFIRGTPGQTQFTFPHYSTSYYYAIGSAGDIDGDGVTDLTELLIRTSPTAKTESGGDSTLGLSVISPR